MKFKKFFAVLSSAALSLSMLAAVNVSANTPGEIRPDGTYAIGFDVDEQAGGAIVKWIYEGEDTVEVVIPEKTEAGVPIVGIDEMAFYDCYNLQTVVLPDTIKSDNISPVAYLRKKDVESLLLENGQDMSLTTGLAYAANVVQFKGYNGWKGDEEELESAKEVLRNIKEKEGYENNDEITLDQAADIVRDLFCAESWGTKDQFVREEDTIDTTKMSQKSYDLFNAWVYLINEDLTIKANEDSEAAANAKAKEMLGVKFEAKETHLIGDANQDGVVNVRDCAAIARAMANKSHFDEFIKCEICADYNGDKVVNVRDAAQLANYLAKHKTTTTLPDYVEVSENMLMK